MNTPRNPVTLYEVFGAGVWLALFSATASILKGTPYVAPMLLMMIGGAVIFLVILPMTLFRPLLPPR